MPPELMTLLVNSGQSTRKLCNTVFQTLGRARTTAHSDTIHKILYIILLGLNISKLLLTLQNH